MPKSQRANRELIRAINSSAVLNTVKNYGPVSRAEVARRTGLSAATVSGISAELIERGLIFEKEAGDSSGGRRPILLALQPRGGFVIGIKLAESQLTGALTDLEATPIARRSCSLIDHSLEPAMEAISSLVQALLDEGEIRAEKCLGVGIGLAGIVDARHGLLRHSPIFGWRDVPLASLLESRLNIPVYIDNDVNTLTITEQWFGVGQWVENFLVVTVGRGVGMGLVLNGRLYHGASGGAGELGHTVIDPQGPVCECGKRGCLEQYVADPALLRMASEAHAQGLLKTRPENIENLLALAFDGELQARQAFVHAGRALGQGLANLVNLLNPELIILSGEGVRAGDLLFEPMQAEMSLHVMPGLKGDTRLQIDAWDDDAWARGAAGLVLRQLFESPMHWESQEPVRAQTSA